MWVIGWNRNFTPVEFWRDSFTSIHLDLNFLCLEGGLCCSEAYVADAPPQDTTMTMTSATMSFGCYVFRLGSRQYRINPITHPLSHHYCCHVQTRGVPPPPRALLFTWAEERHRTRVLGSGCWDRW